MAPHLDIYGLTRNREVETIARFLDVYVDRAASEDRGDEELALEPLDAVPDRQDFGAIEWEPARTLTRIVQRGLDYPRRTFFVSLAARRADIDGINLGFTRDNRLVLGFSIDDRDKWPESDEEGKALLLELLDQFPCYLGVVRGETPPPMSEAEFRALADEPDTVLFISREP